MPIVRSLIRSIPRPVRGLVPPAVRRAIKGILLPQAASSASSGAAAAGDSELARKVAAIRWFHTIDLGNGTVTPGVDESGDKLRRIHLPESLAGLSVLDIGAWDGFFSFEAERRGASEVLAVDSFVWNNKTWGSKAGFELVRSLRKSRVKDKELEVMDIGVDTVGTKDVVLFLGVFYHLEDPILALRKVASVTNKLLILETEAAFSPFNRSLMYLFPGSSYNRDASNWWVPTPAAVRDLLLMVGFTRVEQVDRYTVNWWPWTGRAVFHAYK